MIEIIQAVRAVIYTPLNLCIYLPGGPLRHMAIVRFLARWTNTFDEPLRNELTRRFNAKST